MQANPVLKTSLSFPRMILIPVVPVMNLFMWLSFLVPLVQPIYTLLLKTLWLPLGGYIISTAWLYQQVRVLRPILAIISIPLLVIVDILILIIPNPSEVDKFKKASMIDSWPYPQRVTAHRNVNTHLVMNDGRRLRYGVDNLPDSRPKVRECTLCGEMVRADWKRCPRCREWLNGHHAYSEPSNGESHSYEFYPLPMSKSRFGECTLCGEMVKIDWVRCPRCGEFVSDSKRLSLASRATIKAE